jgi:hypothetical protein
MKVKSTISRKEKDALATPNFIRIYGSPEIKKQKKEKGSEKG